MEFLSVGALVLVQRRGEDATYNDIEQSFARDVEWNILDDYSRGNNIIIKPHSGLGTGKALLVQSGGRTTAGANVTRLRRRHGSSVGG